MRRFLLWTVGIVVGLPLLAVLLLGADTLIASQRSDPGPADAAIILGAAVVRDAPTPVFAERLRHGGELYRTGRVKHLVLTGGLAPGDRLTESEAGRDWLIAEGIPADAILLETQSHTTLENFAFALPVMRANNIGRVLVVSDPLHMRRAMRMALDLGIDAHPSPTPTSRFRSLDTQVPMLIREIFFSASYALIGR